MVIQHDETERLRRVAPNARFEKGQGGSNVSIIDRPGGYRVYSETDSNGQLLRRYRRGPDGRDVIIIDNRRRHGNGFGKGVATGVGIGIGVVAGAAILNSILDVPPPRVRIPRDKYIVDYGRANDDDLYEALSAPPVDDYDDRYSLDEIRATVGLRDRMRRIDLDDITFEFGSWDVDPSQYRKLERIARGMNRVIDRNPNEVFMIEGYTDAVGSEEDNLSLSDRRAESVAEVLSEQFNVPFENLVTQGYGEQYLKVPTQAPERLNRRVAVRRITPLLSRDNGPPPPPSRYPD
ncbi:OmpA family protein [Hyphomicrobium sp.]|uniref:OmpA family protein n=1 Tax=Hyphomicrobium sp. TaxID=82 RepID=UPI0025BA197D|nr:OmpA family protein [Hyphomicrobium sp.]